MVSLLALLPCLCCVAQEEVSHCAAGVRWLKHLHKVAKSQQAAAAAEAPADKQQITTGSHSSSSTAQQCSTANNTHQHPGDGSAVAAAADDDWPADAQQYDTVEEWFHALIRRHFKGNLKVRSICACQGRWCCLVAVTLPLAAQHRLFLHCQSVWW